MKWTWTAAGLIALAGCSQTQRNEEQAGAENQSVQAANNETVGGSPEAVPGNAPSESVSSGMPVPGTNTPEHVVENEQTIANNINGL